MPDAESRRNFYVTLRQWGLASADDFREMEDWNPLGGTVGTAILAGEYAGSGNGTAGGGSTFTG
jgi:hypothetical protein